MSVLPYRIGGLILVALGVLFLSDQALFVPPRSDPRMHDDFLFLAEISLGAGLIFAVASLRVGWIKALDQALFVVPLALATAFTLVSLIERDAENVFAGVVLFVFIVWGRISRSEETAEGWTAWGRSLFLLGCACSAIFFVIALLSLSQGLSQSTPIASAISVGFLLLGLLLRRILSGA